MGDRTSRAPGETPVTGIGEPSLVIVTAGEYATEAEAREAADSLPFADVQGFYVDETDNYRVLGSYRRVSPDLTFIRDEMGQRSPAFPDVVLEHLDGTTALTPGRWMLLSAFRTRRGAEEFMELARVLTGRNDFVALRVRKLAGPFVGLGQESHPDGSGPLLHPLSDQEEHQT